MTIAKSEEEAKEGKEEEEEGREEEEEKELLDRVEAASAASEVQEAEEKAGVEQEVRNEGELGVGVGKADDADYRKIFTVNFIDMVEVQYQYYN